MINSRLTKGAVATPLLFFSGRSKTLKKVTKGIKVISFTYFAVIFMKKKMEVPPYPGYGKPSKSEGDGVDGAFFQFLDI